MGRPLAPPFLEKAVAVALAAAVFGFAAGSSGILAVQDPARDLRWVGLFAVCLLAFVLAATRLKTSVVPSPLVFALAGLFVALVLASAAWSFAPKLTLERGGSLAMVIVAAGGLAFAAAGRPETITRLLAGLLGGAAAVALAGLVVLVVDPDLAVQGAGANSAARFRGFAQNPNTAPLLYALAIPIAVWLTAGAAPWTRRRVLGTACFALLASSMFASGSRGATYASFVGVALVLVTIRRPPKSRFAYLAGAALLYAGSVTLFDLRSVAVEFAGAPEATVAPTPLPEPVPEEEAPGEPRPIERSVPGSVADRSDGSRPVAPRPERPPGEERPTREFTLRDAIERFGVAPVVHMGGDAYQLGLSRPEGYYTPTPVGLFGAHQGRFVVWRGALDDIVKRPFWGYGFGLEESVFVDRYYDFQGSRPESSVLGLAIQVGTVGLAAFVAFALAILGVLVGALRRGPPEQRELVAVCGGVLLAGLLLGLVQSYVYSVGNIATLTLWVAGFLLTAAAVPRGERRRPIARSRLAAYAVALAAFVAVAVATGRWETDAYEQGELAKLAEVRAAVGPRLEGPTLSDYWHDESGFACLRYRDGQDPYAIMLCFDPETGELARAVDERGGRPLHYRVPQGASGSSPLHVSPTYLRRLISRIARAQELLYDT